MCEICEKFPRDRAVRVARKAAMAYIDALTKGLKDEFPEARDDKLNLDTARPLADLSMDLVFSFWVMNVADETEVRTAADEQIQRLMGLVLADADIGGLPN